MADTSLFSDASEVEDTSQLEQQQIQSYVEVTSPQLLDDKWQEFIFDLATGHNVLEDTVTTESGSGYVYRDAKQLGSATHNRFIYWRTTSDILELIEVSTEMVLEDNQVRIRFVNSHIINNVTVIEFSDCIVIVVATIYSVHRLYLPHPRTTNKSVLADLTSEVLFNPANYYILSQHGSSSSPHPVSASSWLDQSQIKCALSFPDSSILIVQFGHQTHHITTNEIKQSGIIGRLWSKMPNFWAKNANECDNTIFASAPMTIEDGSDVLLVTLCRDCRIRVFSTRTKECVCSFNMIPQASFHQSFAAHVNPTCEVPVLKISGSQIFVYQAEEFTLLDHSFEGGSHELTEVLKLPAPRWEQMIDFALTEDKIWALGSTESESTLYYFNLSDFEQDTTMNIDATVVLDATWKKVYVFDEIPRGTVAEIFWSNRFSAETVRKALVCLAGPQIPKVNSMVELEEFASTRIFDGDQDKQWTKFFNYCLQSHQTANKNIGLVVAMDGSVVSVVKRSNPSFITPGLIQLQERIPYRGLSMPDPSSRFSKDLSKIWSMVDENLAVTFDHKLQDDPYLITNFIQETAQKLNWKLWFQCPDADFLPTIDELCDKLDLTEQSKRFNDKILGEVSRKMRSEHSPLGSNFGISITYELFRQTVRARLTLVRDILLYISILRNYSETDKPDALKIYEELYSSGRLKRLLDCLRSYGALVWAAEAPIKINTQQVSRDVIEQLAKHFEFFKSARDIPDKNASSTIEKALQQNLLTSFLSGGGINFSWSIHGISHDKSTLSSSEYAHNIALNLCMLLWPKSNHLCLPEFMFSQQLDEHLAKYLDLTDVWLEECETDRHFIRGANCMLQNRSTHGVEIFNKLWMRVSPNNIVGRFVGLTPDNSVTDCHLTLDPNLIYRYYEKLIELFQAHNNRHCLVMLISHCMALIDEKTDSDQQSRINCLRAKLFQFHLELEDSDEAYHTMVLTTDPSLRFNCLRKFIVSHCEKSQWMNLLSYPFIEIKEDFIDILNQKAQSLDLSKLDEGSFYKTSYYDLLFASYISDDEYKCAAEIMYSYAHRLAQEVPGITSIRKQADCLLVALNSLRCVDEKERYLEFRASGQKEKIRTSILKRSHDGDLDSSTNQLQSGDHSSNEPLGTKVDCKEIERRYELTRARLRLLEKDQTGNAIALSPLTPEETVAQLVASSMFTAAMDLALLFGTSMAPILEGLTAKYILVMRLSAVDISVHQDVERGLSDVFTSSYSIIDTYNYVANSTSPLADRLWHLIHYYLITHDGVSHTYQTSEFANSFSNTTLLMRVVARKLLSAGYDVPGSLKRLYLARNGPELLRLLMKYDKLMDAADLAVEMIDRTLEPANCLAFSSPSGSTRLPPIYLPTHLMLLLITYLNEDATNTQHIKLANVISDRLNRFRDFVKAN